MEIQSAKTTPDTSPSPSVNSSLYILDRRSHGTFPPLLLPHLIEERSKIYRSAPRDLDHVGDPPSAEVVGACSRETVRPRAFLFYRFNSSSPTAHRPNYEFTEARKVNL